MKIIINADDCGRSIKIDNAITGLLNKGLISSTTIMPNGIDFESVKNMYGTYKEQASFGVHMTFDTLEPVLFSEILRDKGYYIKQNDKWLLNIEPFRNTIPPKVVRKEIINEVIAQINKVRDYGINISHLDSHHHTHASLLGLSIMDDIIKRAGISKIRRMRNLCCSKRWIWMRNTWMGYMSICSSAKSSDYFCGFEEFVKSNSFKLLKDNEVVELMCHPGDEKLKEENEMIEQNILSRLCPHKLISYNDI